MRRLIAIGALALLVLAVVPFTSAGTTPLTKHVDGSLVVSPVGGTQTWIARFEVRTTASGVVQFGYMELYGVAGTAAGEIVQFTIKKVTYAKTPSGAQGVTFTDSQECRITDWAPCFSSGYNMSDGSRVGKPDTFLDWTILSGDISIYTTGGQNQQ